MRHKVKQQYISDEYSHWKHQYSFIERLSQKEYNDLYLWLIYNLTDVGGWYLYDYGLIILKPKDAFIFLMAKAELVNEPR